MHWSWQNTLIYYLLNSSSEEILSPIQHPYPCSQLALPPN